MHPQTILIPLVALSMGILGCSSPQGEETRPPNFIIVFADDQGYAPGFARVACRDPARPRHRLADRRMEPQQPWKTGRRSHTPDDCILER